jgi:hypothetical protein
MVGTWAMAATWAMVGPWAMAATWAMVGKQFRADNEDATPFPAGGNGLGNQRKVGKTTSPLLAYFHHN